MVKKAKIAKLSKNASKIPEIDFTENLSDRKFLKFPHCVETIDVL